MLASTKNYIGCFPFGDTSIVLSLLLIERQGR